MSKSLNEKKQVLKWIKTWDKAGLSLKKGKKMN